MDSYEVIIQEAILHILGVPGGEPLLSDLLLPITPEVSELITSQVIRLHDGDDVKTCHFNKETSDFYHNLRDLTEENFVAFTHNEAAAMFDLMSRNIKIPAGDLLFAICLIHHETYLAILKLGYKKGLLHLTRDNNGRQENRLTEQVGTLPPPKSKLSEAILIHLGDEQIRLVEKACEIDGEKVNYLSELFLGCYTHMSEKSKLGVVRHAIDKLNDKYYDGEVEKQMKIRAALNTAMSEEGPTRIGELASALYPDSPEAATGFLERVEKTNLQTEALAPKEDSTVKSIGFMKLVSESGLEIKIPVEVYRDTNDLEITEETDGTTTIKIANLRGLYLK